MRMLKSEERPTMKQKEFLYDSCVPDQHGIHPSLGDTANLVQLSEFGSF